jgi:hypothetical protein
MHKSRGALLHGRLKFYVVAPNTSCVITLVFSKNVYPFKCSEHSAPGNTEGHKSLQNCGSSVWNLLQFSHLSNRISKWLLYFWKMGGVLVVVNLEISHSNRLYRYQSLNDYYPTVYRHKKGCKNLSSC